METFIKEILTSASPLAVLGLVVFLFLRFLDRKQDKDGAMLMSMHQDHMSAREASRLALKENADVTRANTQALQDLARVVTRTISQSQ